MKIYNKETLYHPDLYLSKFTKDTNMPYVVFIHGGPGLNCGIIEYLIEHHKLFNSLDHNIILYDQRNCGRSNKISETVLHQDNIEDLQKIILHLTNHYKLKISALIGHSYGAKLLFDYYKNNSSLIPGVFVSTANSILTPRLNNLMLDLSYLKRNNLDQYNKLLNEINSPDLDKIWEISEELTPLFQENKDRPYFYWANLGRFHAVQEAQKHINLPLDMNTFVSVRKDLYSNESNFSVDIDNLEISKLWINGFHDFVMNGHEMERSNTPKIVTFYQSSHYPHIEENDHFNELLNEFIKHS